VRILADGADPFTVIDPIRIAAHGRIAGAMTADGLLTGGAVNTYNYIDRFPSDAAALEGDLEVLVVLLAGGGALPMTID
jgi:hypothetical protein